MATDKAYVTSTFKVPKELWRNFKGIAGTTGLKLNVFLIRLIKNIVEKPEIYLPEILHGDFSDE